MISESCWETGLRVVGDLRFLALLGMIWQRNLLSKEPDSDGLTVTAVGEIEYGE